MSGPKPAIAHDYRELLLRSLVAGHRPARRDAKQLGLRAREAGMTLLDLGSAHGRILGNELLPQASGRAGSAIANAAASIFASACQGAGFDAAAGLAEVQSLHVDIVNQATARVRLQTQLAAAQADQATIAEELRQFKDKHLAMITESKRSQQHLRQISRRLLSDQEEERRQISRELHDVIGQTLAGIAIRLSALTQEARLKSASIHGHIAQAQRLVRKSLQIVHRFARQLRPPVLDDLGLVPALEAQVKKMVRSRGLKMSLTSSPAVEELGVVQRTTLFRVAVEALTNVVRHARAKHAMLDLTCCDRIITMVIQDDGRAFPVEQVLSCPSHQRLGIVGMRERVEMLGGTFNIISDPAIGTKITAAIPLTGASSLLRSVQSGKRSKRSKLSSQVQPQGASP